MSAGWREFRQAADDSLSTYASAQHPQDIFSQSSIFSISSQSSLPVDAVGSTPSSQNYEVITDGQLRFSLSSQRDSSSVTRPHGSSTDDHRTDNSVCTQEKTRDREFHNSTLKEHHAEGFTEDVEISCNLQECSGINKETVSGQVVLKESPETPMYLRRKRQSDMTQSADQNYGKVVKLKFDMNRINKTEEHQPDMKKRNENERENVKLKV